MLTRPNGIYFCSRLLLLLSKHSAPQLAASQEAVPALFGGVVSFDLINAFATNRTKANMNPTTAVPYITEAVPNPSFPWHRAHLSMAAFPCVWMHSSASMSPIGLLFKT